MLLSFSVLITSIVHIAREIGFQGGGIGDRPYAKNALSLGVVDGFRSAAPAELVTGLQFMSTASADFSRLRLYSTLFLRRRGIDSIERTLRLSCKL